MEIKRAYTKDSFYQAIAMAKYEGHYFLGLTWDSAIFKDLVILRRYED